MQKDKQQGFTLIEIMLVVVIIGVMLAVVVPRAWRANIDAKYGTLRQVCAELAGYANDWAKQQLESQHPESSATLNAYFTTLAPNTGFNGTNWVAAPAAVNNWSGTAVTVIGRDDGTGSNTAASAVVSDLLPPGAGLRNPFNGLEVFQPGNVPGSTAVPGALYSGWANETVDAVVYNYYALIFQGTGNTGNTDFHAGMGTDLVGLRQGIFIARAR